MRRFVTLPLLLALALSAGACGGSDETASSGPAGSGSGETLVHDTPDPSADIESLTWALDYEPTSLDWAYSYNYGENTVLANVCENLLRLTPDYEIEPGLATAFEHPDPTTWIYTIREGVTFNDGSEMTVDDVVFSLRRQIDPDVGSYWASWWANVKSVEKSGPTQVTVTLKKPDVIFNQMMATPAGGVESEAFVEQQGANYGTPDGGVNCTGPFKLEQWKKGESITLVRNDGYWDQALKARAARVEIPFITEEATLTSALINGEIDGSFDVPPASYDQLKQAGSGKLWFGPSMQTFNVIVSSFDGALGDARIRRAMMLALDREGIVKAALGGRAEVLRSVVPPSSWGYAEETLQSGYDALPAPERDLEAAQALVDEAGVPSETIVLATLAEDEALTIISNALKDAADRLGLKLQIKTLPVGKYAPLFFDAKAREGIDMFLTGWYTDIPEPLNMWATIFTSDGGSNYNGYSNPQYDELMSQATQAEDPEQRAQLINQAQAIVGEDAPWIPLYAPDVAVWLNSRATGVPTTFVYLYYPWLAEIGAA